MDWKHLFTSLEGRIGRKSYWIGFLLIVLFYVGVLSVAVQALGTDVIGAPINILQLLALYPVAAVTVKRLHDRNRPGWLVWLLLAPIGLSAVLGLSGLSDPMNRSALDMVLQGLAMLVSFWFLIELGILRGTPGQNDFGPDPVDRSQADVRMEG